jgi:peptidoglycan/xylan/chitin deacetylase (PgdA/CDA1 family)
MPGRRRSTAGTPPERRWRTRISLLGIAAAAAVSLASGIGLLTPADAATPRITVVSLTFDDSDADQIPAAQTLLSNGLRGTFFVNSGFLGAAGYMTTAQVQALAKAGNEIGGHTVNHPDLTTISTAEAKRQICLDRSNLSSLGLSVTDFAYPFASQNASVQSIVRACGYNSARGLGDIRSPFGCPDCAAAETVPPRNALDTAALDEAESTWTLQDLQDPITNAAPTGGWVQYTFHHVCPTGTTCDDPQVSSALFTRFVQWLAAKVQAKGSTVQVKTVAQVVATAAKPVVAATYTAPAGPGVNAIRNPSLESTDASTALPTCFAKAGYGANTPTFSGSAAPRTGTKAEQLLMSGYQNGDAKLLPTLDLGDCSPTVVAGHTYSLREWYTSTAVTQFAVYIRSQYGAWTYWTSSPWFPASSTDQQAVWTTPAVPAGTTGISFGLNLFSNGTLVTDDWSMYDSVGAPALPAAIAARSTIAPAGRASTAKVRGGEAEGAVQVPDGAHE